ncbi:rRNA-processing protein FCF1-like protein [Bienertia sinuspersici]
MAMAVFDGVDELYKPQSWSESFVFTPFLSSSFLLCDSLLFSNSSNFRHQQQVLNPKKKDHEAENLPRNVPYVSAALFFEYNTALGPPHWVLVDTNFINFSIQNKLDLEKGMMYYLYAKCTPCITDCVMAELEKLGQKYRVALRVTQHKCYIVATCDRDLKHRIRKILGVPIMYITQHNSEILMLGIEMLSKRLRSCIPSVL